MPSVFCQNDLKRQSLFFELAGSGGLGSLNYEQIFDSGKQLSFGWRLGLSLAPIDKNNGIGLVFPAMVQVLMGRTAHKFELGLGQGITITTKGQFFLLTTPSIGYRLQPARKNWFYRATYTPLVSYLADFQVQQWAGMSIGYTFKKSRR
ncbi:MAG: hypothetical protein SFV55_24075 [Haliscomenobacter sp.]|uniref:hypothetical protein n=1 Tax=Haliscomenobacter sp. TaxID=2717303 RepID=UPI0029B461B9|nr:hypothetical protein [Haliscomenobacter sp.]MDX2071529.1 hypothetical protein [Haliscomenobacter sp.]